MASSKARGEREPEAYPQGYVEEFARLRTTLGIFFIGLTMDVQDFLVQGEGHEEDKREAWTLFQQAYERQMKGELEEAVSLYKRSLATHPTAEAYTFLGWTYSFMGRLDDAIEEFRKALGSRSHRLPFSEALGQGFVEQERSQVAATVLSRALRESGGRRTKGRCALSSRIFMRRPAALGRGS